jgi:hypothetical protein
MAKDASGFFASLPRVVSNMKKIKDGIVSGVVWGWNRFLEGADCVADKISRYPKTALVLFVAYVMVRQ